MNKKPNDSAIGGHRGTVAIHHFEEAPPWLDSSSIFEQEMPPPINSPLYSGAGAAPLPQRCRGELTSQPVTIEPGKQVTLQVKPGFTFWPDKWRVDGDKEGLFLRQAVWGAATMYPKYRYKPGIISRAAAAQFDAEEKRHSEEGVSLEEATRHPLTGRCLLASSSCAFTFENRSKKTVSFVLVLEGQEVA